MFEKQNLKEEIKLVENLIHKFDKENYFFRLWSKPIKILN